jgi:hypothetical protein
MISFSSNIYCLGFSYQDKLEKSTLVKFMEREKC